MPQHGHQPAQRRPNPTKRAERGPFCYQLRREGHTLDQIAELATVHFGERVSRNMARDYIDAIMAEGKKEVVRDAKQWVSEQLDTLMYLDQQAAEIANLTHFKTNNGELVMVIAVDEHGQNIMHDGVPVRVPIYDSGPRLEAIRTRLQISESMRKLLGTDGLLKVDSGKDTRPIRYSIDGVDMKALT